jgi:uncharacterized membrane protein HdeD (DUF308 family)
MTMPEGYNNPSSTQRVVSSRSGKAAQIIGIILLVSGGLILLASLEASEAAALFFGIFLAVMGVIIIIRAGGKNEGQATKELKSQSKAKHGLVLIMYFLTALALCYGLYSEYWMAGESLIESMGLAIVLLIVGGGLDESFGTTLWIRDILLNRKKKG